MSWFWLNWKGSATEGLAKIKFSDGNTLIFEGAPTDSEIGVAYLGDNPQRSIPVQAALASPTRLFASLSRQTYRCRGCFGGGRLKS